VPGTTDASPDLVLTARRFLRHVDLGVALFPGHLSSAGLYIMVDLFIAQRTNLQVSISAACIAARVPPTTALRWVQRLCREGLLRRRPDPLDKRRHIVELTEQADGRIKAWLQAVQDTL
jgi:hypothetical protein